MRELPVFDVYTHSLRSIRDNLGFAFQISWPWMLALLPFNIAANVYVTFYQSASLQSTHPDVAIVSIGLGLLTLVAFASIAVMWHRHVLLDETPTGFARFRLDATVWRYIGNTILILLILALSGIVAMLIFWACLAVSKVLAALVGVIGGIALLFSYISYFLRLGVKLPAVAVGERNYSFGDALRDTKGNYWRFIGLSLLIVITSAFVGLVVAVVAYLASATNMEPLLYVSIAVQFFVNWLVTVWNVTILTTLYSYFGQGQEV